MRAAPALFASLMVIAVASSTGPGCGASVETGASSEGSTVSSGGAQGGGASSSASMSSAGGGGGASGGGNGGGGAGCADVVKCQGLVFACGDGIDNDGDGLADAADPDCYGPCHNKEDSLHLNIPMFMDPGCKADCYFDADAGSGNDDCHWSHKCDPNEVAPNYYPETNEGAYCAYDPNASIPGSALGCAELKTTQTANCHAFCDPIVPNGCDCFGCCELPAGSQSFVWLGSEGDDLMPSCSLDAAQDPSKCHPCEPVPGCMNACDTCEVCLGKTSVPAGCDEALQCAPGVQPCGLPGQACCPSGFYCITGCCQPEPT